MKTRLRLSPFFIGMALLAAISCSQLKLPGANSTTSSGPARASSDPLEALKKAFTAQLAARSFRARMQYSVANTGMHNDLEFVAPDRYHVTMMGPTIQGRGMKQEIIIVGKDTFTKIGDMPWQKTVMNTAESTLATTIGEMAEQFRTQDVSQRMTKYEDVKFVGQDVLDGQPVGVYKFKLEGTKGPSAGQIWISTADDLPRKIEHEASSRTNSDKGKLTITYYDYNATINIVPPI